jgi:iron complex outermembrane receptor protein
MAPEIKERLIELAPCRAGIPGAPGVGGPGPCDRAPTAVGSDRAGNDRAKRIVQQELANGLDSRPWEGDFNICSSKPEFRDPSGQFCNPDKGKTRNDTYGGYLQGTIVLPTGIQLTTSTGYDHYDRLIDIDLDMSPSTLFEIHTEDDGWNASQGLRLAGELGDEGSVRWDIGGWFLREQLNVFVGNDLGPFSAFAVGSRDYTQHMWSTAGYASLAFDFWDDFTLDGGFRYNWEQKKLDYFLALGGGSLLGARTEQLDDTWSAPTGTVRLTYRFREDTHAYWKYTRGWKPGTYNATSSIFTGVSTAEPETIDAFETGLRGSWFDGRLGLDFSLFYYDYTNYQIFTAQQFAGGQPEFVIINANDAEVYGAEIDAIARPWPGAFANVRFGWLQSEFLDFVQVQQEIIIVRGAQVTVNRELQNTGNSLLNSPQFKVSLTGEQTIPLGRFGFLTARYDGVWTDTTYYDATEGVGLPNQTDVQYLPNETIAQKPYWLHNLRLAYRPPGGRIEIAGWVRNLTNESYKTFAFDASTFNSTSIYFVGDPRTFGGTITVTF